MSLHYESRITTEDPVRHTQTIELIGAVNRYSFTFIMIINITTKIREVNGVQYFPVKTYYAKIMKYNDYEQN